MDWGGGPRVGLVVKDPSKKSTPKKYRNRSDYRTRSFNFVIIRRIIKIRVWKKYEL